MGRVKVDLIRNYFHYDSTTKTQKCKIDNCGKTISNDHLANLRRRVKIFHKKTNIEYEMKLIETQKNPDKIVEKNIKYIQYIFEKFQKKYY